MILLWQSKEVAVNIQIYGKSKCFDTKKAERYFKERRIKYQFIDLPRYGLSPGELRSLKNVLGGLNQLLNQDAPGYAESGIPYLSTKEAVEEKLLANPALFKTPIVRNGKQATVGYAPEVWQKWE